MKKKYGFMTKTLQMLRRLCGERQKEHGHTTIQCRRHEIFKTHWGFYEYVVPDGTLQRIQLFCVSALNRRLPELDKYSPGGAACL